MALTPLVILSLLAVGLAIGVFSGMIGIGGGVMVIPALIYLFHFTQKQANGTSLAMLLPPIGIFAVLTYHRAGNINWPVAMLLASGFAGGAYVGGLLVNSGKVPEEKLRLLFAALLVYLACRMLFQTERTVRAAVETLAIMIGFGATYTIMKLLGRKWSRAPYFPSIYQDRAKAPAQHDYEI